MNATHHPIAEPLLLSTKQVAQLLNISERHVHNLRASGGFPQPIQLGRAVRWSADQIKDWIAKNAQALAPESPVR